MNDKFWKIIEFFVKNRSNIAVISDEDISDLIAVSEVAIFGEYSYEQKYETVGLLSEISNKRNVSYPCLKSLINICLKVIDSSLDHGIRSFAFDIIIHIIIESALCIKEKWFLFWQLKHRIFVNTIFDDKILGLHEAYESIYYYYEGVLGYLHEQICEKSNTIVIVTSQFWGDTHAPTRRVLDYAYLLKKMDYEIFIINDGGINFVNLGYENGIEYNFCDSYSIYNHIEYKDEKFGFYQNPCIMPDTEAIRKMLNLIYQIKPRLILNVGDCNLTTDLCRRFALTASYPCETSIPITASEKIILGRNLRVEDKEILDTLKPWQSVIEANFNYKMLANEATCDYTRETLSVPKNAWVIVCAGNRMSKELDRDFLVRMDNLLGEIDDAYFCIIGNIVDKEEIILGLNNSEKIIFTGTIPYAFNAIKLMNLYVQPTRKGGGRAAFEALYFGIPVIVTKYGDSWDVCSSTFEVADYDEMFKLIRKYHDNDEFYNDMREKAFDRGRLLGDMELTIKNIIKDLGI